MKSKPLAAREFELIQGIFERHPKISEVRLFGSRAKGTHSAHSDIDLAIWGDVDALYAEALAAQLDELPLPYRFDVLPFHLIRSNPLREHIERVGLLIYSSPISAPARCQ
jgi:predicted nucleotidyltransferase